MHTPLEGSDPYLLHTGYLCLEEAARVVRQGALDVGEGRDYFDP